MAKTMLIVDQDMLFVEPLRQRALNTGYRVLTARSQKEAENIIDSTRPDLVITEIMLEQPDSGFCLAWKVKKKYPDVPVIIVSSVTWHTGMYFSLSTPEDRNWIKADRLMNKPVRHEELEAAVSSAMQSAKAA